MVWTYCGSALPCSVLDVWKNKTLFLISDLKRTLFLFWQDVIPIRNFYKTLFLFQNLSKTLFRNLKQDLIPKTLVRHPKKTTIAAVLSGLPILEIGHQVPHLIRIYTKKESLKVFFRFIKNVSRPLNSRVHACLIWIFDQGKSLFSDGLFLKRLELCY